MSESHFDPSQLGTLLPESAVGRVASISPIRLGLSGAGVYAVTTDRGEYVLRVQNKTSSDLVWSRHLMVLRRASAAGIAPALVHLDEEARATVTVRINGQLAQALGDPSQRDRAIVSIIGQLRAVHALDPSGIEELNAVDYAKGVFETQRNRNGFPAWALGLTSTLDGISKLLHADPRRVVSHNDMNPGNVLWDGQKAWLIDWEVTSLSHPYYDVATLAAFLNLDLTQASGLVGLQEQRALDESDIAMLAALGRLAAIAVGCTMLGLVPEIVGAPESREDAPTLADIYAEMRTGTFDLQSAKGQTAFALAFLRVATAA